MTFVNYREDLAVFLNAYHVPRSGRGRRELVEHKSFVAFKVELQRPSDEAPIQSQAASDGPATMSESS